MPELMLYFPDLEANELPDSDFMWSVLATLREDEIKKLISEVRKNSDLGNEENKQVLIEIHPKFLSALLAA